MMSSSLIEMASRRLRGSIYVVLYGHPHQFNRSKIRWCLVFGSCHPIYLFFRLESPLRIPIGRSKGIRTEQRMIKAIFSLPGDNDGGILPSLLRPWQRLHCKYFSLFCCTWIRLRGNNYKWSKARRITVSRHAHKHMHA